MKVLLEKWHITKTDILIIRAVEKFEFILEK